MDILAEIILIKIKTINETIVSALAGLAVEMRMRVYVLKLCVIVKIIVIIVKNVKIKKNTQSSR